MVPTTGKPKTERWSDGWLIKLLLDAGVLANEDIDVLLESSSATVWGACVKAGLVSEDSILAAVARRFCLPIANTTHVDVEARSALPAEFARKHRVAPLHVKGRVLEVATSDVMSLDLESTIAFASGRRVRLSLASPDQVDALIERLYPSSDAINSLIDEMRPDAGGRADCPGDSRARQRHPPRSG
jgi:type IV pilus assembly protein PilB